MGRGRRIRAAWAIEVGPEAGPWNGSHVEPTWWAVTANPNRKWLRHAASCPAKGVKIGNMEFGPNNSSSINIYRCERTSTLSMPNPPLIATISAFEVKMPH